MAIEKWLENFSKGWRSKDMDAVLGLFSKDVEYWENPYKKIAYSEITKEWAVINEQSISNLVFDLEICEEDYYCVKWVLEYSKNNILHNWSGLYLIRLNKEGLCTYFYQVGENE